MKDIIIIGAGVAGLTCAWQLSQRLPSAEIVVLEKKNEIGMHKTNATLQQSFVNQLREWGLGKAIEREYSKIGLYTSNKNAKFDYEKPIGASFDYFELCRLLAGKAKVTILTGTAAEKIVVDDEKVVVDGMEGKFLIDASGHNLALQRYLNVPKPSKYFLCYGEKFKNVKGHDPSEFSLIFKTEQTTGGGWFYPAAGDTVSFGIAYFSNKSEPQYHEIAAAYREALRMAKPFCDCLRDAKPISTEVGLAPIEPSRKLVYKRAIAVGDAGGQCTPLNGEGVRPTMNSAIACSDKIATAFNEDKPRILAMYENEWRKRWLNKYLLERAAGDFSFRRTLEGWDEALERVKKVDKWDVLATLSTEHKRPVRQGIKLTDVAKIALNYSKYRIKHTFGF